MGVTTYPDVVIPAGFLMPSARTGAVPSGWLLCDGTTKLRSDYPDLFAAISTTYNTGGEAGTEFRLPNLKGKTIVMQDAAQTEFDTLGEAGGSKVSTAVHTHAFTSGGPSNNTSAGPSGNLTGGINWAETAGHWPSNNETGWVSSWHRHAFNHWHLAWTSAMHWNATQTHGHHDRPGIASEAPWEGANWAGGTSVNVDGTAQAGPGGNNWTGDPNNNHLHGMNNHWHQTPNHDHGMGNHTHGLQSHTHGGTSGGGSADVASGNLQPYLTLNYLIKT